MKIIHVLNHFLPQQTAGTEVYTWALSKELQALGHEVKVCIPNYGCLEDSSYVYDNVVVHQFAEPSTVDRRLIMGHRIADGVKHFKKWILAEKPTLIHFHELAGSNGISLAHVKMAKASGAKVIMTFHLASYTCKTGTLLYKDKDLCNGKINAWKCANCYLHKKGVGVFSPFLTSVSMGLNILKIDPSKWNHSIGTALGTVQLVKDMDLKLKLLLKYCDQFICLTDWYEKVLRLNGIPQEKITKIYQGLPTKINNTNHLENTVRKENQALKLMFLGRLSPFKGLHLLIEALSHFKDSEVELSIFGAEDGTDYAEMLRQKTINNSNIHWRGLLSQDKVLEEMQQHDLLCLCSTFSEMSPLVIQEARAARLPIIASKVYGNVEQLVQGGAGSLFEMHSVSSLRSRIQEVIDNRDKIKEWKDILVEPRNFDQVAQEYHQLYQHLSKQ
jgi:glycosyltransferase involved in cell wall biosynthesis